MNVASQGPRWEGRIVVADDAEAMSRAAAGFLEDTLRRKPSALLCLATGASPARTYELLAERGRADATLFARARLMKLDEWLGLSPDDPSSCGHFLRQKLIEPLGLAADRLFGWQSRPADPTAECRRIAAWLAANGPIDVNILGMGTNGHLGFNEPAEALQPGPHIAELSAASLSHSMLDGSRGPILAGLTIGMADILRSREIVLLVSGPHKAEQLQRFFTGRITPHFPVSFLWLHPRVHLFCDRQAAARLPREVLP